MHCLIMQPTQIDHLKANLCEGKKFIVDNFAVPGDTTQDDLSRQIERFFARYPDRPQLGKPDRCSSLDPTTTLYGKLSISSQSLRHLTVCPVSMRY